MNVRGRRRRFLSNNNQATTATRFSWFAPPTGSDARRKCRCEKQPRPASIRTDCKIAATRMTARDQSALDRRRRIRNRPGDATIEPTLNARRVVAWRIDHREKIATNKSAKIFANGKIFAKNRLRTRPAAALGLFHRSIAQRPSVPTSYQSRDAMRHSNQVICAHAWRAWIVYRSSISYAAEVNKTASTVFLV
jgi:hypothetical protein